ncbi:LGT_TIGR03299, phage/plasmid-like protein TIGR03299 [uncultured Caudovirales phage]|uniref:LGT_TIGR03299, phage/plasmid-like protein TIGR03299 n=1 Tax=uncultured Caudovirales phage TaxID=2100421 RepID=A0A6J5LQ57_9CAUD|nr:LGT_TIGR03299, phage/plasmid-like protein TIGR03299 [uncultured Caudovirales phage]
MAHLIESTNGKAEIAYAGQTPWHGLGQQLTANASIDVWRKEAGLDWEARLSPVVYTTDGQIYSEMPNQNVIYRSDTSAPLGVVTNRYKVHQPADVLNFFNTLVQSAGFTLEVAGAIKGGKRIWALANVNREAVVLQDDAVRGYLLLSTSFDGTSATVGQFTSIRVVCNNTLSAADREDSLSRVNITHGASFDASLMRDKLGLVVGGFDGMMDNYRRLARQGVSSEYAKQFTNELFPAAYNQQTNTFKESRGFKRVLELFDGAGMGANSYGVYGTKWGLLNAVTQYIDHERGHNVDTRMNNAWFGNGDRLKTQAEELLLA